MPSRQAHGPEFPEGSELRKLSQSLILFSLGESMDGMSTAHPNERPLQRRSRFYFRFVCLAIISNQVALLVAWLDRSWIAFGVAMVWGPALNACLILGALLVIPRSRQHKGFSLGNTL